MLTTLVAAVLLAPDNGRVASASLFKNGYAVVVREYPASGSEVVIDELPQPSLGTLWITASDGVQIAQVVKTTREVSSEHEAQNLQEILKANLGSTVTLGLSYEEEVVGKRITGKLLSLGSEALIVKTDQGLVAIEPRNVHSIVSYTGELIYKTTVKSTKNVLDVKLKSGRGSIYLVGLERGMTWAPSYAIDISDPKQLSIVAKATVLDDLADLNDVELKFVTGFPNVPWLSYLDPFLSGNSVDQFTAMLSSVGQNGFGGLGGQMALQNAAAPREAMRDMDRAFTPNTVPGVQAEDLFFYREPHVSLKNGDRAYFIMFKAVSAYEHLYTLDLPDRVENNYEYRPLPPTAMPPDVWHTLKFKNTSNQPLTTAPATVFQKGEVLGQDTLDYASVGADVLVRMSKALDVHADATEEEVKREQAALRLPNGIFYDLVTLKGSIALENFKHESVHMKITKDFTGELVSADGNAAATKTAKALQQVNPTGRLVWNAQVGPGEKRTLTYTYKLYVRMN